MPRDLPHPIGLRHVAASCLAATLTVFVLPTLAAMLISGGF